MLSLSKYQDLRLVGDQSVPEVLFQELQIHGGGMAGGAILREPYSSLVLISGKTCSSNISL